jgi:hypothetical protein
LQVGEKQAKTIKLMTTMTKQEFLKSNLFKVLLVCLIAVSIIKIFSGGYDFGQWLYNATH